MGGFADQEIAKRITGEGWLEVEVAEVVGGELWREAFEIEVAQPADIYAALESVVAERVGDVVGDLRRARLRDACFVAADGREACTGVEVEGGESVGERMLADVYASEIELREGA